MYCELCGKWLLVSFVSFVLVVEAHSCHHTHEQSQMGDQLGRFQASLRASTASSGVQPDSFKSY
jgi:hypothetical protein